MPFVESDRDAAGVDISVLIVTYHSRGFIDACLDALFASETGARVEVLLIDNGTDGTGDHVAARWPRVRVLPAVGNVGFGAGNNRLAEAARGEALLLLNPDVHLLPDSIAKLHAFAAERPEAAAWGGRTMGADGRPDMGNHIALPTLGGLARAALGGGGSPRRHGLADDARAPQRVDVLCGAYMLIRAADFRALGGFDEGFFLYSEEVDLFARMKAAGMQAWATPESIAVHDTGSGSAHSPARFLFKLTGQMHYARKHWGPAGAFAAGLLLWAAAAERWLGGLILGGRSPRLRALGAAYGPIVARPWRWWSGYSRRR